MLRPLVASVCLMPRPLAAVVHRQNVVTVTDDAFDTRAGHELLCVLKTVGSVSHLSCLSLLV